MANKKWTAGWGASISYIAQNHAEYIKNQTFRYVIFPTVDTEAMRLHFSNEYGDEPLVINKVCLAIRTHGEFVDVSTNVPVTYKGKGEITIPAGGSIVSDDIAFSVKAGQEFDVSMYFEGLTHLVTGHSNGGNYIVKYFGNGDWADKEAMPLLEYGEGGPYVALNTIDFLTNEDCHSIIAFGDSITAQPWPDCLAHRLYDLGIRNCSVIRKGIGGGRILREYQIKLKRHWGVAGIRRFERDITQEGVDRVFVLHGINDLIHPKEGSRICPMNELPTTEELIENGYKKYIEIARKHDMKIYLATILPCPRCMLDDGIREKIRCEVNEWIRTKAECDGVIDFEAAVWNPDDHKQIKAEYDSGDHLHPSFAGATHMAESIPLEFVND